mmetsp:Transcript_51020/g.81461  ORF Transcript_51020/g.81461 Transcript_51020/m.81461 type:complete len:95 (-) Transcript_51020:125-409(-)
MSHLTMKRAFGASGLVPFQKWQRLRQLDVSSSLVQKITDANTFTEKAQACDVPHDCRTVHSQRKAAIQSFAARRLHWFSVAKVEDHKELPNPGL